MKLRIIKRVITNGLGEAELCYIIQKRGVFQWRDIGVTAQYFTHYDPNLIPRRGALLTDWSFTFKTESEAKAFLNKVKENFSIKYKGNKIVRVFHHDAKTDVYINKSVYRKWDDDLCYEFSSSLEDLKREIDRRYKKTTIEVVT